MDTTDPKDPKPPGLKHDPTTLVPLMIRLARADEVLDERGRPCLVYFFYIVDPENPGQFITTTLPSGEVVPVLISSVPIAPALPTPISRIRPLNPRGS